MNQEMEVIVTILFQNKKVQKVIVRYETQLKTK